MSYTVKQLAQSHRTTTNLESIYARPANTEVIINNIIICNVTAAPVTFRVCLDDNGTTYSIATALHWDQSIPGNSTVTLEKKIFMNTAGGNLAVQAGASDALTFTVNGQEFS